MNINYISSYLWQLIVNPEIVAKKLKAMKDNKSEKQISISLARVFNMSLKEGVVFSMQRSKHHTII